jgi:hypothetical protein
MLSFLNRSAIILEPKQPYVDWANSLEGPRYEHAIDDSEAIPVFLGPNVDELEQVTTCVNKNYDLFFEEWLEYWCTDPALWPQKRTRKMFREWFTVRIHTMVFDTVELPFELE